MLAIKKKVNHAPRASSLKLVFLLWVLWHLTPFSLLFPFPSYPCPGSLAGSPWSLKVPQWRDSPGLCPWPSSHPVPLLKWLSMVLPCRMSSICWWLSFPPLQPQPQPWVSINLLNVVSWMLNKCLNVDHTSWELEYHVPWATSLSRLASSCYDIILRR